MAAIHMDLREKHQVGDSRELLLPPREAAACRSLGIRHAGISQAGAGFAFTRNAPDMVQVLACLAGRGEALVDGGWQEVRGGQAYLTPSGIRHAYRARGGKPWSLVWVIFEPDRVSPPPHPVLVEGDARPLHDAVANLHREYLGAAQTEFLERWTGLIAACCRRWLRDDRDDGARLQPLWEAVTADLAHAWTLAELAALIDLSTEHLRRLCQASLGRSPMQEVGRLRLEHARQLLGWSDEPIARIAEQVGYRNPFAFSTAFKRHFGRPPRDCRRP